ncbi:GNAT family N-acetyltransferase [Arthrobacter sp. E3]|uniref:GNAT family N-acetyltransferase n=1 Tax=Arthrobacter sp. E3 TaxID=517402 RepID=UPI001A93EF24|nr:GNAT family N-acetyltransferase [Arthrobacter sp. E3]
MVTLADCQRTQHAWFRALAEATGGRSFSTHKMDWVWLPETREMLCMFPTDINATGLEPVLAEAERRGATAVGIWMSAAIRKSILPQYGFELGWQPWWMTRSLDLDSVPGGSQAHDDRVSVTAVVPDQVWLATARSPDQEGTAPEGTAQEGQGQQGDPSASEQEWAGRGYAYMPPEQGTKHLAGIFDMVVAPEHRRKGMGTAMLNQLSEAAFNAGAEHLLLNATPDGQQLYKKRGFELIGKGQTWWFHPTQ